MFRRMSLVTLVLLLLPSVVAAATDPFAGKWKLDVGRSKYPAGTCPMSMVIEMRPAEQGVWYHSDATYKNGREIHAQYTAGYDGKQVIVMGGRGLLLPVSLKRLNSHTVVASYSRGLSVVATSRRVVSTDGRFMTITTASIDASGKKEITLGVYQRQLQGKD
jgi:hypothetical protein